MARANMPIRFRLVAVAAILTPTVLSAGGREPSARSALTTGSRTAPITVIAAAAPHGPAELATVSAGQRLHVRMIARPSATAVWQLVHDDTVLKKGRTTLDGKGRKDLELTAPVVRHRVRLALVIDIDGRRTSQPILVLPKTMLSGSSDQLHKLDLGVIDSTGWVPRVLRGEGVAFTNLSTQHAADFFRGKCVILAGYESVAELTHSYRRLSGRVAGGMSLIILDPPAGWSGGGVRQERPKSPLAAPVRFAQGFGRVLRAEDLGTGPWRACFASGDGAKNVVWFTRPARDGQPTGKRVVVLTSQVKRGRIVVGALPATADRGVIAQCMLKELILWVLHQRQRRGDDGKETL